MIQHLRVKLTGADWAQPVVLRRWVPITLLLEAVKRATHYRIAVRPAHRAWERACGIERLSK